MKALFKIAKKLPDDIMVENFYRGMSVRLGTWNLSKQIDHTVRLYLLAARKPV